MQPELIPVWICAVVGAGVMNALPGTFAVALAFTGAEGAVCRWQVSQVVDDGMCEVAPTGEVAGMTMIFVTPTKLEPLMLGPWQATQLSLIHN